MDRLIYLFGALLMSGGIVVLLGITPEVMTQDIMSLLSRQRSLKYLVAKAQGKVRRSRLQQAVMNVRSALTATHSENKFSLLISVSLIGICAGFLLAALLQNLLLIPIFSGICVVLPYAYVNMLLANYNRRISEELETALSIITTNYVSNDDIIYAVEQSIDYINPPVQQDFNNRCTRVENTANVIGCKIRIMANQQKESYQHLSPTYPQIPEIREENARQYLVGDIIGGFPFASGSFTDSGGFYLGRDSNDGLILLDPWIRNRQRPNSNMTIVGGSGSGKSTAIKHIIASEYARGTKIIVIDPEGEYKDMCLNPLFEGSWIDVAGGRGGLINPLQIRPVPPDVDDNSDPVKKDSIGDLAVHLKTLQTFFRLYIPSMDDRLRAILDQSLVELYFSFGITWETDVSGMKAERFPILSDLYKLISCKSESGGRNAECYADLKTYLEGAANGADHLLWNGYTTINPTSGFIVLDTKSLIQMSGTVLAAQYFNVLSWCWEQITRDRKERIMLIADECWTMIDPRCPQSLEFLKNAEKRARKYEGSIVVGTQSTNDFLDPEVKFYGQSVLDLPTYKLLFSMDGQSLKEAAELFDLNDSQTELISSGQRGMALMKVGRQAAKVRFVLSDERLEMFGRGGGR